MAASSNFRMFLNVMLFYIFLSFILFPAAFYFFFNYSLKTAGNGFVAGSLVSIVLWYTYGSTLIQ